MSRARRILLLALVLLAGIWAFFFSLANSAALPLDLVFLRLPPLSIGFWVISAFVAGGCTGLLAASAAIWRARLAATAANRKLVEAAARAGNG